MSWLDITTLGLNVITLICVAVIVPMRGRIYKLQDNELAHIQGSLDRIEAKLDDHLKWHLNGGGQ